MSEVLNTLQAATSLVSATYDDQENNPYFIEPSHQTLSTTSSTVQLVHSKYALQKLKEGNVYEKSELQRLNSQLHSYLENVKMLESLNRSLMSEVEKAKLNHKPDISINKLEMSSSFESLKQKLEHHHLSNAETRLRIEDSEKLSHLLNERIAFFHKETELTRNRINALQAYLNDIEGQRQYLMRGAASAQEEINREFDRQLLAEKDIENLRLALKEAKMKNKKIEYEIKTMLDMIAFYKHAYSEEVFFKYYFK